MITIVNYGLGNVRAFANVYNRLGKDVRIAHSAGELEGATRLILPGVGSFDHAMHLLECSGMRVMLDHLVLQKGVPVLGVCVGMQMMAHSSDEGGSTGLGWVDGTVKRLHPTDGSNSMILPHMGWNDVYPVQPNRLFEGLEAEARFYFLHSFAFNVVKASNSVAVADYAGHFTCAVQHGNVFGVQFHPEKSHHFGIKLLQNFAEM